MSRREEWLEQVKLALLLDKMAGPCLHVLDRDRSGSAFGNQRCDAQEARRQARRAGLVWYFGKSIGLELKSRRGQCSRPQRAVREALLRAGAQWWVCRSARAAMWALAQSGVPFRALTNSDGVLEHWQPPRLPEWEVPKRNPHERRPRAPDWELGAAAAEIAERGRSSMIASVSDAPRNSPLVSANRRAC